MISIIVPTYNEQSNVAPLTLRLAKVLTGLSYEIVFIDDNSRDGTVGAIYQLASVGYPVSVYVRLSERGLATAVLEGVNRTRGDIIVVMDADLQHPPEIVPQLIRSINYKGADFVVGSRYIDGGGCSNWGLMRKIVSRGAILLSYIYLRRARLLHDTTSGFYAFRRDCIEGVRFEPIGYKIMLEMYIIGHFEHVTEVPFVFEIRVTGRSKMKLRQQLDYIRHLSSLRRRSRLL